MSLEQPIWFQNEAYAARLDRQIVSAIGEEGVLLSATYTTPFKVTQRAAGVNYSVDVATGYATVKGDNQANQGSYFLHNATALVNVPVTAPPASNARITSIILRVYDVQAGSGAGPGGVLGNLEAIDGATAASPVAPAVPASALLLATILVPSGLASIQNANITDKRKLARTEIVVSAVAPADLIEGLIWFQPA